VKFWIRMRKPQLQVTTMVLLSMRQEHDPDLARWIQMNNKMFLKLEFWADPFPDCLFLFHDSVGHLKISVWSTQVWPRPACLAGTGVNLETTKDKSLSFLQIFGGVLQNQSIEMSYLRGGWIKMPTSET